MALPRRRQVCGSLVLLSFLPLAGCGRKAPRAQAVPRDATVLALGDSLTSGVGASADTAYPTLLARIFHRSRATNEYGIALVCPKIQVSNLDQRAGNAEAKLYRRN